jgi:excisionase family DNA binding protein
MGEKLTLSVDEAASLLGFSTKRLRHLVAQHRIPHRRQGSRIVLLRSELLQWLDSGLPGVTLEEVMRRGER